MQTANADVAASQPGLAEAPGAMQPRDILNSVRAVLYDWDMTNDALAWGANVGEVLSAFPAEALTTGAGFTGLVGAECVTSRYLAIKSSNLRDDGAGAPYRANYRLRASSGADVEVEDIGRWFADAHGRPARAHGVLRVLCADSGPAFEGLEISAMAERGVCSRARLVGAIAKLCSGGRGRRASFAVLIVDVDGLKETNLRDGYDAGDLVLASVARRLGRNLRGADLLARYAGGKFAILLAAVDAEHAPTAIRRLIASGQKEPASSPARAVGIRLRVGAALAPAHGENAQMLLQRAEEALERTAASHENIAIFQPGAAQAEANISAIGLADEILAALNERRIVLAYQPVVSTRSGKPQFFEALLRIRGLDGALCGPAAYLPVAERAGLMTQIDHRVCELALRHMKENAELRVAINISVATLRDPAWFERFRAALNQTPGAAQRLIVEIVETVAIGDVGALTELLGKVKALGVRIAMDDFGAGHTSFRNLRALGIDIVKIDGAFVQNIARSADDRFFVRTLAELAQHLGIETVAEWVEDAEAQKTLTALGIDCLQGFYLGRPEVPLDAPVAGARAVG